MVYEGENTGMETVQYIDLFSVICELMRIVIWIMVSVFLMFGGGIVFFLVLVWKSIDSLECPSTINRKRSTF